MPAIATFEAQTADEVWLSLARSCRSEDSAWVEQASRCGQTRELLGAVLRIEEPTQRWVSSRQPALNPAFALAEVIWILNGRNDSRFLTEFFPRLSVYQGREAKFPGAYGYRLRNSFGLDQVLRAYRALQANPDSRQVVLQVWDPQQDLPNEDGSPRSEDIPCNVSSLLKVRRGALHWLQIMRSNDLWRGLPYNMVQFTSLQEVIAGWLEVEVGPYTHVCDSVHAYVADMANIEASVPGSVPANSDSLRLPKETSDHAIREVGRRVDDLMMSSGRRAFVRRSTWREGPEGFANMFVIMAAELARRRGYKGVSDGLIEECSNPAYCAMWERWRDRVSRGLSPGKGGW